MIPQERAVQQRDPLGALIGRPTSYLAAVVIPVYAALTSWRNVGDIAHPTLAVVALLFVAVASVALVLASSPLRAPLTVRSHVLIVGASVAALLASAASMWGTDAYLRDDWGGAVAGLFIVSLAPYRPAKELVTSGALAAIFAGFVALVQADSFVTPAPVGAFVIAAATPIVAMSVGAAAFVDVLVRSLDRWRARADRAFTSWSGERGESIARSVQQDSVTVLNQEVVPLFSDLLGGGVVDEATRERARAIAHELRTLMVADVDRTWLDTVIEQLGRGADAPPAATATVVRDGDRLAEHMSVDERTAVRAFIVALHGDPALSDEGAEIVISAEGGRCVVQLRVALNYEVSAVKGSLAPFLAVVRVMFSDLQVDHEQPDLTLRFSYERR